LAEKAIFKVALYGSVREPKKVGPISKNHQKMQGWWAVNSFKREGVLELYVLKHIFTLRGEWVKFVESQLCIGY